MAENKGMTLVEIAVSIGVAGILTLAVGQMIYMNSKNQQLATRKIDFQLLKHELTLLFSKQSTCLQTLGAPPNPQVVLPAAFVDPVLAGAVQFPLAVLYDGRSGPIPPAVLPAARPFITAAGGRFGSIQIANIQLDKVATLRSVVNQNTKVLANLRFWTGTTQSAAVVGSEDWGHAIGQNQLKDYIPVILEVTAAGTVVGCTAAGSDLLTGQTLTVCPMGQIYTMVTDISGTGVGMGCRAY